MNLKIWNSGLIYCCTIFFLVVIASDSMWAEEKKPSFFCGGCKTEYYMVKALFDAFDAEGRVLQIGNKRAIELMLQKEIDFAFTCQPLSKLSKTLKLDSKSIATWEDIAIAMDPLVVISNSENGIVDSNLAKEQLTDIFAGKVSNWKRVGANDLPVQVLYLDTKVESGVPLLFKEFTFGIDKDFTGNAKTMASPEALGRVVSKVPGSITFMGFNSYKKEFGDVVKIDGVSPDNETILNGKYPLSVTYYLIVDKNRSKDVSDFIGFCFSKQGKKVIAENYIPIVDG